MVKTTAAELNIIATPEVLEAEMGMFLDRDELIHLTGRVRKDAQVRVLRFMGIEHKVRPDGSVAVLRLHVEQSLGCQMTGDTKPEIEPNWGALFSS